MRSLTLWTPARAAAEKGCGRAAVLAAIERGELVPRSVHVGADDAPASVGLWPADVRAWTPRVRGWAKGKARG